MSFNTDPSKNIGKNDKKYIEPKNVDEYINLIKRLQLTKEENNFIKKVISECSEGQDPVKCLETELADFIEDFIEKNPRLKSILNYHTDNPSFYAHLKRKFDNNEPFSSLNLFIALINRRNKIESKESIDENIKPIAPLGGESLSVEYKKILLNAIRDVDKKLCMYGQGNYGVVYGSCENRAVAEHFNFMESDIAIKVFRTKSEIDKRLAGLDPRQANMFKLSTNTPEREAELQKVAWELLKDKEDILVGVPRPYWVVKDPNTRIDYMIMEEVYGLNFEELRYIIKSNTSVGHPKFPKWLTVDMFVKIKEELKKGIKYLNDKGLFHRDLHPRNIMIPTLTPLNGEPVVYIIDFGTSKLSSRENAYTTLGVGGETIRFVKDESILKELDYFEEDIRNMEKAQKQTARGYIQDFILKNKSFEGENHIPKTNLFFSKTLPENSIPIGVINTDIGEIVVYRKI